MISPIVSNEIRKPLQYRHNLLFDQDSARQGAQSTMATFKLKSSEHPSLNIKPTKNLLRDASIQSIKKDKHFERKMKQYKNHLPYENQNEADLIDPNLNNRSAKSVLQFSEPFQPNKNMMNEPQSV